MWLFVWYAFIFLLSWILFAVLILKHPSYESYYIGPDYFGVAVASMFAGLIWPLSLIALLVITAAKLIVALTENYSMEDLIEHIKERSEKWKEVDTAENKQ